MLLRRWKSQTRLQGRTKEPPPHTPFSSVTIIAIYSLLTNTAGESGVSSFIRDLIQNTFNTSRRRQMGVCRLSARALVGGAAWGIVDVWEFRDTSNECDFKTHNPWGACHRKCGFQRQKPCGDKRLRHARTADRSGLRRLILYVQVVGDERQYA